MKTVSRIRIGQIKYNGISIALYLSNLDGFNTMAANVNNQSILISASYFHLNENEKEVFMWHEIGHVINRSCDEFSADKFSTARTSKEQFEQALDDAYMRSISRLYYRREKAIFRSYQIYRINAIMETEIKHIKETFIIELYDEFKGDIGVEKMIKISKNLKEKDTGR